MLYLTNSMTDIGTVPQISDRLFELVGRRLVCDPTFCSNLRDLGCTSYPKYKLLVKITKRCLTSKRS